MTPHQKAWPCPQPATLKPRLARKETYEYESDGDTFAPLKLTEHVQNCMSKDYKLPLAEDSALSHQRTETVAYPNVIKRDKECRRLN